MLQCQHAVPLARRSLSRPSPLMGTQVPQWLDTAYPSLYFLSITVFSMNNDYISTPFISCVNSLVMVALYEPHPRIASWNEVPINTFNIFAHFCKQNYIHDRHIIAWSHLFSFPLCGRTGGCQMTHSCTLMI